MDLRKSFWAWAVSSALLGVIVPSNASANGRFPRAQLLKAYKDDLVFVATFGMMVSADKGKNWYFVCERSMLGIPAAELETVDLFLERGSDGSIISGSNRGLRVSRDMGCNLQTDPTLPISPAYHDGKQPNPTGLVIDIAPQKAKSPQAFVAAATITDDNKDSPKNLRHQLYESLDDARSFKPLGAPISLNDVSVIYTIDASPLDPNLMYMTVRPPGEGKEDQFWISKDGGRTWPDRHEVAGSRKGPDGSDGAGTYIAAIHPTDANVIFARSQFWLPPVDAGKFAYDPVLVSKDGGKTWQEVLRKKAPALGFTLSPDGSTVLVSYGHTGVFGELSDEGDFGIYKADVQTLKFERLTDYSGSCLSWNQNGVYACSSTVRSPYMVGFRKDADFKLDDSEAITPLLSTQEAKGPLPWDGERRDQCVGEWLRSEKFAGVCDIFLQCPDDPKDLKIGSGPPICRSAGGGGGAGGTSTGSGGSSGSPNKGSCGCHLPGGGYSKVTGLGVGLALFALFRRGRNRRRPFAIDHGHS